MLRFVPPHWRRLSVATSFLRPASDADGGFDVLETIGTVVTIPSLSPSYISAVERVVNRTVAGSFAICCSEASLTRRMVLITTRNPAVPEIPLHSINPDREAIFQQEILRVLRQD
jgi:hypothetical protein